jgi:hypothetical protein
MNYGMKCRAKATQVWEVGNKVNVGFLRDLEILKISDDNGKTVYELRDQKGNMYVFIPHEGIFNL